MAKTEDIEAKLAAYVDGELDEAGRAQIEQHLVDHPQHRALIKDLMQQKQLVASLPRLSAPPEVAETFNSQLERAVLLGDVDGGADQGPILRIGYFSHLRAVAAMLILTGGLAGAIWYLLPTGARTPQLADVRVTPLPSASPSEAPTSNPMELPLVAERDFDAVVDGLRASDALERRSTTEPAPMIAMGGGAMGGGGGGRGGGGAGASPIAPELGVIPAVDDQQPAVAAARPEPDNGNVVADRMLADSMKLGPPTPANGSFLYVFATDNPNFANQQVTSYLTSNGITWENESEPKPAPLNLAESQTGFASRMVREDVAMKNSAPQSQVAQQQQQQNVQNVQNASLSNRIIARQVPRSRAMEVVAGLDKIQNQTRQEPFSLQNSAVSQVQAKESVDLAARQMAKATGLVESNVHGQDQIMSPPMSDNRAPTTSPFGAANYAPVIELNDTKTAVALSPATQRVDETLLQKDVSKLDLNASAPPTQDLVDMVIVVQGGEAAPTTQP